VGAHGSVAAATAVVVFVVVVLAERTAAEIHKRPHALATRVKWTTDVTYMGGRRAATLTTRLTAAARAATPTMDHGLEQRKYYQFNAVMKHLMDGLHVIVERYCAAAVCQQRAARPSKAQ
jgi:hypothetical protein